MKIAGIYKITNRINGKVYIGQTVDFKRRKKHHFVDLRHGKHCNAHMQKAFDKYGEANFTMELLFECDESLLDQEEIRVIKQYHATDSRYGYNLMTGGQKYRHFTKEVREKMSAARKGRKFSPQHKAHLSASRKGIKIPREAVERIRQTKLLRRSQWAERNPNALITNETAEKIIIALLNGKTVKEAAKLYGATVNTVYNLKKGRGYVEVRPDLRAALRNKKAADDNARLQKAMSLIRQGLSANKAAQIAHVSRNTIREAIKSSAC